jgi:glycosyltransferase involved in cell wall biosynthesis
LFGLSKKLAEVSFYSLTLKKVAPFVVNRNFFWQLQKAISANADLYIGHNLGALPVARTAAKKTGAKFGFDAEDFHRNEMADNTTDKDVLIKTSVEEQNFPGLHHFTAASPLIANAYKKLFPTLDPTVILNVFPKTKLSTQNREAGENIRLFWFSQTLGDNRGIEVIVQAMGKTRQRVFELHLLGNSSPGYKEKIGQLALTSGVNNQLFFYDPVPENEIFQLASKCDIGMASETGIPYNRDICLTNKIFTYIQSGLAVVASDTTAQKEFIGNYPSAGKVYSRSDSASLASILDYYVDNREELEASKHSNHHLGQTFMNWETEQEKYIDCIRMLFPAHKELSVC